MSEIFGARLAEERQRIGRSQVQLATLVGATKRSQIDWESGAASPKAIYLMGMAQEGIDVLYLLTGERSKPVQDTLTARQRSLLAYFDAADEAGKRFIEGAAMRAAQPDAAPRTGATMVNRGAGAVQIGSAGGNVKVRR